MRKDKILAFINAGIFLFFGNSFLLLFDIMNHSCILELCFVGERGDQGNVSALINGILIRNDAVNVFLVDRFQTRKKRNGIC